MNLQAASNTAVPTGRLAWIIAFISASILGFEISLMRLLLLSSWHHFAFLVISIALLGFGASGTLLVMFRRYFMRHGRTALLWLAFLSMISMPLCAMLAQTIPIEARLAPALLYRQLMQWMAYWALLTVPFFIAASCIGLTLMSAGQRLPMVYASNLLGSGIGVIVASAAMYFMPPQWLPTLMGGVALPALVAAAFGNRRKHIIIVAGGVAMLGVLTLTVTPFVRIDPYKDLAYMHRLQAQGDAQSVARDYSPRGVVEIYRSPRFHRIPFMSSRQTAPPVDALLVDGHWVGSRLNVAGSEDANFLDDTLMAFGYLQLARNSNVLLLDEIGGVNIYLAARFGAASIDVIQPHREVSELLQGPLGDGTRQLMRRDNVSLIVAEPRSFLQHPPDSSKRYDLIQFSALESIAAGSQGIGGLGQNHLITVEGMGAALRRLSPEGILMVCRGIQTPPRDNLKLFATLVEALRRNGIQHPDQHVIIVRDFLAVCTLVKPTPWSGEQTETVRAQCRSRELTPIWYRGIRSDELNHPDEFPGPPGMQGDWYHHAARQLFSDRAQEFVDQWRFDIRPPIDDRPFFADFCKLSSIAALEEAFGELWLTRAELALLFVIVAMVLVGGCGAVLTVAPLLLLPSLRGTPGRAVTGCYFALIGLGYLLLEMVYLSRLTQLIGDPVLTAAATIATFLLASGAGSMVAQRIRRHSARAVLLSVILLILIALIEWFSFSWLLHWVGDWPASGRNVVAALLVAPPAFLMGFPMPLGLRRLDRGQQVLLPWAWGVNGFASVVATPLATVIGMSWGFSHAGAVALMLYLAAATLPVRLPDSSI